MQSDSAFSTQPPIYPATPHVGPDVVAALGLLAGLLLGAGVGWFAAKGYWLDRCNLANKDQVSLPVPMDYRDVVIRQQGSGQVVDTRLSVNGKTVAELKPAKKTKRGGRS